MAEVSDDVLNQLGKVPGLTTGEKPPPPKPQIPSPVPAPPLDIPSEREVLDAMRESGVIEDEGWDKAGTEDYPAITAGLARMRAMPGGITTGDWRDRPRAALASLAARERTSLALWLGGPQAVPEALALTQGFKPTAGEIEFVSQVLQGINPVEEAEIQAAAKRKGVPEEVIRGNLDEIRHSDNAAKLLFIVNQMNTDGSARYPGLVNFLRTGKNLHLAYDDVTALAELESAIVDTFGTEAQKTLYATKAVGMNVAGGILQAAMDANEAGDRINDMFYGTTRENYLGSRFAEETKEWLIAPRSLETLGTAGTVVSIAPQIAASMAAFAIHPVLGVASMFSQSAGRTSAELQDAGLSLGERLPWSVAGAAGETALEFAQFKALVKPFWRIMNPQGRPFKTFVWGLGKMGAVSSIETPQGMWTDLMYRAGVSDSPTEFFDGLPAYMRDSFVQGVYESAIMMPWSALFGATRLGYDMAQARRLRPVYEAFDKVMESAAQSETRKRAPETFEREFVAPAIERTPMDQVVIPREQWNEQFESVPDEGAAFAKKLGIERQLAEGGDGPPIVASLSKFATYAPDVAQAKALRPWLRFGIHDVSLGDAEAQAEQLYAFLKEQRAEAKLAQEEAEEFIAEAQALVESLKAAGFSSDFAKDTVELIRQFGATMAKRLSKAPAAWWKENAPNIQGMEFAQYKKMREDAKAAGMEVLDLPIKPKSGVYVRHKRMIALFEEANQRTVFHELYHFFEHDLEAGAEKSPEVQSILDLLQKHGTPESRADSFWRYLREGVAPSPKLAKVFTRLRRWLMALYHRVRGQLTVESDLRDLFEKMLASDAEIDAARMEMREQEEAAELWKTLVGQLDIPSERKAELKFLWERALESAKETRLKRALDTYRRANKRSAIITSDAENAVAKEPFYQMLQGIIDADMKMDRGEFRLFAAGIGKENAEAVLKRFPEIFAKEGKLPAEVALALDMTPEQLLADLQSNVSFKERVAQVFKEMLSQHEQDYLAEVEKEPYLDILDADMLAVAAHQYTVLAEHVDALVAEKEKAAAAAEKEGAKGKKAIERGREEKEEKVAKATEAFDRGVESMAFGWTRKINISAARSMARMEIMKLSVRAATSPKRFLFAAAKSSQAALQALKKQDILETLRQKHLEIHYLAMAEVAAKLTGEIKTAVGNMKAFFTTKNVAGAYKAQTIQIGNQFRLTERTADTNEDVTDFVTRVAREKAAAMESSEDESSPLAFVPDLSNADVWGFLKQGSKNHQDLTLQEFKNLGWLMGWLTGTGLREVQMSKEAEAIALDDAVKQYAAPMNERVQDLPVAEEGSWKHARQRKQRTYQAEREEVISVALKADGLANIGKSTNPGPNERGWYDGLSRAQSAQLVETHKFLSAHGAAIVSGRWPLLEASVNSRGQEFDVPGVARNRNVEINGRMRALGRTKWNWNSFMAALLNTGNRGNKRAMNGGFGFTAGDIAALRSFATEAELDWVQAVWDSYEYLYPIINAPYKKQFFQDLVRVEAEPFTVTFADGRVREYRGGYHPLIFDSKLSDRAGQNEEIDLYRQHNDALFEAPTPERSFSYERKGGRLPPLLDLGVVVRHWTHAIHYGTHYEPLRHADLVTRHPLWRETYVRKFGLQSYEKIRPALNYIANPPHGAYDQTESMFQAFRHQVYSYALMLNFTAAIPQPTAAVNSMQGVGVLRFHAAFAKELGRLLGRTATGAATGDVAQYLRDKADFIRARPHLQMRLDTAEREARNGLVGLGEMSFGVRAAKWKASAEEFKWACSKIFGLMDLSSLTVVCEAYEAKYKEEHAHDTADPVKLEQDARDFARRRIEAEQPMLTPLSSTFLQREKGLKQIFNFFITPGLLYYNRSKVFRRALKEGRITGAQFAFHLIAEHVAAPLAFGMVQHLLRSGEVVPDETDLAEMMLSWWLLPRPVLMLIMGASGIAGFQRPTRTPILRPIEMLADVARTGKNVFKDPEDTKRWLDFLWAAGGAADVRMGIPATKWIKTALEGVQEIGEGGRWWAPIVRKDYRHKKQKAAYYK